MSQENVELVRRSYEAFNRDPEDWFATFDSEVEFEDLQPPPDARGSGRGLDAFRAYAAEILEVFEEFRCELEESIDEGNYVVSVVRYWGKGRQSALEVDFKAVDVHEIRDGKIIRLTSGYPDKVAALRAVASSS
jgi:ketosteroid isomerase-like protein